MGDCGKGGAAVCRDRFCPGGTVFCDWFLLRKHRYPGRTPVRGDPADIDRVAVAQWMVSYNLTIMKALFSSCGNLVTLLGTGQTVELSIDPSQAEVIKELGFGTSIVFLILAVFLSLAVIVCGFFLLYNVYFRFLKILVIVPFGAIASSTLAGNRGISNTFVSFMKYFISVVFEAVTMALAILLCNAFISSGLPAFTGDYADWAKTLIYLGEMTFTAALTVGTVKGAQNLTSRALGL